MSFCRITGKSRNLPKPNFFPVMPPMSPADVKRLCRITTKRMDQHHFVPLLEVGKRPDCCPFDGHSALPVRHSARVDVKYVTPILKKEIMDPADQRVFEDLQKVLKKLKRTDDDQMFVYTLPGQLYALIIPAEVEEAIRIGELENLSISKSCKSAIFKLKGRPTLVVPLKEVDIRAEGKKVQGLFDGCGQNKATLEKQIRILEDKNKKILAQKKIFEDLERQGEDEVPRGAGTRSSARWKGLSKEAKEFRFKLEAFKDLYLPHRNMANYGHGWQDQVRPDLVNLDWTKAARVRTLDLADQGSNPLSRLTMAKKIRPKVQRPRNIYIPENPGLEMVPWLPPDPLPLLNPVIPEGLLDLIKKPECEYRFSLKSMFASKEAVKILPSLKEAEMVCQQLLDHQDTILIKFGCLYDHGDGLKFCCSPSDAPPDSNVVMGAILSVPNCPAASSPTGKDPETEMMKRVCRFFPGHMIDGLFCPGQRMASANGEFIPGICVRDPDSTSFQLLPGLVCHGHFISGQFIQSDNHKGRVEFVKGQVVQNHHTAKFVHGETISTPDGLKFVAGVTLPEGEDGSHSGFQTGTLIEMGGGQVQFMPGQMIGTSGNDDEDPIVFIMGMHGTDPDGKVVFVPGQAPIPGGQFYPGQMMDVPESGITFIHGQIHGDSRANVHFVPGMFLGQDLQDQFIHGLVCQTPEGALFVEGKLCKINEEATFVPGQSMNGQFIKAQDLNSVNVWREISPDPAPFPIDDRLLSVVFKKIKPKSGYMVTLKDGSFRFCEESEAPPQDAAEVVAGRMEHSENGPSFVPGKIMEINGMKTFIPGKMLKDKNGQEVFVPGKIIQGKNGPKFIPGQVIQTESGEEKFIPGQIMDTSDGVRFVPGQIIETKSGPTFIPGQVLRTDDGLKFVPGQIVETECGALFVPGQVVDAPEGAKFVPGQIMDTADGPRLVPPPFKGEGIKDEYIIQGFDINQEEAWLIVGMSGTCPTDPDEIQDLFGGIGDPAIGGEALLALSDGFGSYDSNCIDIIGAKSPNQDQDLDSILNQEVLDVHDNPQVRASLKDAFLDAFKNLAGNVLPLHLIKDYIDSRLNKFLLFDPNVKLNVALDDLMNVFGGRSGHGDQRPGDEVLNLLGGILASSVSAALQDCHHHSDWSTDYLKSTMTSFVQDSICGILEEDGQLSQGLEHDVKQLIRLAEDLEFGENESFFAKVVALSEGKCSSRFMDSLLKRLKQSDSPLEELTDESGTAELVGRLVNILAPRPHLQAAFTEMMSTNPDFIREVLSCLKQEAAKAESIGQHFSAIDLLHEAITKAVQQRCQMQLDELVHKVELHEHHPDIRSLLEQAIGLAKFLRKDDVSDSLFELLADPIRMEAIKDDAIIKDVLNKILIMRKMCDSKKLDKLRNLNRRGGRGFSDEEDEDSSLREMIRLCDALTKPPHQRHLKKSKSMIKKSKSVILTAKDIPMNAFLAIKSSAGHKDENWLQKFLSESLVEDVPWECSKALILLKEGYQAIIPREASKSILLGEASYTLIDDSGVEFYLSPKDKKQRKKMGLDEPSTKRVTIKDDEGAEQSPRNKSSISPSKSSSYQLFKNNKSMPIDDDAMEDYTIKLNDSELRTQKLEPAAKDYYSESPYRPNRRFTGDLLGCNEALEDEDISMEKYRPHNFEFGRRRDTDDINDIRDFYSGLATRQRAFQRLEHLQSRSNPQQEDLSSAMRPPVRQQSYPMAQDNRPSFQFQPQRGVNGYGASAFQYDEEPEMPSYGRYSSSSWQEASPERLEPEYRTKPSPSTGKSMAAPVELDDTTRYLLDKAKAIRTKPVWDEEIQNSRRKLKYNWDTDTFQEDDDPRSPEVSRPEAAPRSTSTMSSRTQKLLDKVKESTAALEDINQSSAQNLGSWRNYFESPTAYKPTVKKASRFLPSRESPPPPPPASKPYSNGRSGYGKQNEYSMRDMADDILGENIRPSRLEPLHYSHRNNGHAPSSSSSSWDTQKSYDQNPYRQRDQDQQRVAARPAARQLARSDSDDLDAMIRDLKSRTAGRDMFKVVSEIEGREVTRNNLQYQSSSPSPPPTNRHSRGGRGRDFDRGDDDDLQGYRPTKKANGHHQSNYY